MKSSNKEYSASSFQVNGALKKQEFWAGSAWCIQINLNVSL